MPVLCRPLAMCVLFRLLFVLSTGCCRVCSIAATSVTNMMRAKRLTCSQSSCNVYPPPPPSDVRHHLSVSLCAAVASALALYLWFHSQIRPFCSLSPFTVPSTLGTLSQFQESQLDDDMIVYLCACQPAPSDETLRSIVAVSKPDNFDDEDEVRVCEECKG